MLPATDEEKQEIIDYMNWQAPDLKVEFLQKVYTENVLSHQHVVWDVHTNVDRWWVVTNPTNLYSQNQFPNMDYALTFHIGLMLRVPRTEQEPVAGLELEPFSVVYRQVNEATEALSQASGVTDYQAIGVRCREALLAFTGAAQFIFPWPKGNTSPPKQADFKAWVDHVCSVTLSGAKHEYRRHLQKTLLEEAWRYSNWLTHAKESTWHDAEAATSIISHAITSAVSHIVRVMRGVPEKCPSCGSLDLSPQRGVNEAIPNLEWERPTCDKCGWTGSPVPILTNPEAYASTGSTEGGCIIPNVPLRKLIKPGERS
jgi:hypothetical protein